MNDTKSLISSLRSLSTSIAHTDITKSTLFQDAAAEIERLDKALYEEKEKTRRLIRELRPLKSIEREERMIVTVRAKSAVMTSNAQDRKSAENWVIENAMKKLSDSLNMRELIEWEVKEEDGTVTAEATIHAIYPQGFLSPADPGWFSRNHIDPDSPLMTE